MLWDLGDPIRHSLPHIRTSGQQGPATSAALYLPYGVAVDSSGNIVLTDPDHQPTMHELMSHTAGFTFYSG